MRNIALSVLLCRLRLWCKRKVRNLSRWRRVISFSKAATGGAQVTGARRAVYSQNTNPCVFDHELAGVFPKVTQSALYALRSIHRYITPVSGALNLTLGVPTSRRSTALVIEVLKRPRGLARSTLFSALPSGSPNLTLGFILSAPPTNCAIGAPNITRGFASPR